MTKKPTATRKRSEGVEPPEPRSLAVKSSRRAPTEPTGWRFRLAVRIGSHACEGAFDEWRRGGIDWHHLSPEHQLEMLEAVRDLVGTIEVRNGAERKLRTRLPSDCENGSDEEWGARILQLGELEASVDGNPPDPALVWANERASILVDLAELIVEDEVTSGDAEMGRQNHSTSAKLLLERIEFETVLMSGELDNADERGWLDRGIGSLVLDAFYAGRHYQTASNKPLEQKAVNNSENARSGAVAKNKLQRVKLRPIREKALSRMAELTNKGMSAWNAAERCSRDGLGNKNTIRRWWVESRKKTDQSLAG